MRLIKKKALSAYLCGLGREDTEPETAPSFEVAPRLMVVVMPMWKMLAVFTGIVAPCQQASFSPSSYGMCLRP